MSFGFSPSDVALVIRLATKAYEDYKQSLGDFRELARDIDAFKTILVQARKASELVDSSAQQGGGSEKLTSRSELFLRELDQFYQEHASLSTSKPGKFDKLRWSPKRAGEYRRRIHEHILTWTAYNSFIASSSISDTVTTVTKLLRLIQAQNLENHDEASIRTNQQVLPSPESDTRWIQMAKSLEDTGISHEIIRSVETVYRRIHNQPQSPLHKHPLKTNTEPSEATIVTGDASDTDGLDDSIIRSYETACPGKLEQTSSKPSGDTSKLGDKEESFFEALPKPPPLAFNPEKGN